MRLDPFERGVSPSSIKTYLDCPRKWYFERVLGQRSPDTDATRRGTKVHANIEAYIAGDLARYRDDAGNPYTLGRDENDGLGVPDSHGVLPLVRALIESGEMFTQFPAARRIVEHNTTKHSLAVALEGILINGRVDFIEQSPTGATVITDWKTCSSFNYVPTVEQAKRDIQAIIYSRVISLQFNTTIGEEGLFFRFVYLNWQTTQVRPVVVHWTLDELGAAFEALKPTVRAMKATAQSPLETISPNRSACSKYGGCALIAPCYAVPYTPKGLDTMAAIPNLTTQAPPTTTTLPASVNALGAALGASRAPLSFGLEAPPMAAPLPPKAEPTLHEQAAEAVQFAVNLIKQYAGQPEQVQASAYANVQEHVLRAAGRVYQGEDLDAVVSSVWKTEPPQRNHLTAPAAIVPPDAPVNRAPVAPLARSIEDIELPSRVVTGLGEAGITRVEQLITWLDRGNEWTELSGVGASSADKAQAALDIWLRSAGLPPIASAPAPSRPASAPNNAPAHAPTGQPSGEVALSETLTLYIDCIPEGDPDVLRLETYLANAMQTAAKGQPYYNREEYAKGPREVAAIVGGNLDKFRGRAFICDSQSPVTRYVLEVLYPHASTIVRGVR